MNEGLNSSLQDARCPSWLYSLNWTNTTTISDLNHEMMSRNIPSIVFICVLMVTGIIGNTAVLYVFASRFPQSNYRTYVLCLAFIDEISSCILMPFMIVYLLFPKNFPDNGLCKFGHFIGYFTSTTSAFLLILIAIDRHRKICQPMKRQISKGFAIKSCTAINMLGLVLSVQSLFIYGTTTKTLLVYDSEGVKTVVTETKCFMVDSVLLREFGKAFYIQLQVFLAIVIIFLAVLYSRIMNRLNSHHRESTARLRRHSVTTKSVRSRKTTITFIIITLVFTVSSEIHHILAMLLHFTDDLECYMNKVQGSVFYVFIWTVFLNNISNPFIYGISDERFRKYLKLVIKNTRLSMEANGTNSGSE